MPEAALDVKETPKTSQPLTDSSTQVTSSSPDPEDLARSYAAHWDQGEQIAARVIGAIGRNPQDRPPAAATHEITKTLVEKDLASKREVEEAIQKGLIDQLTGLFTRRGYEYHADAEYRRAQRQNQQITIIEGDLNFLKKINDELQEGGHGAGDVYIKEAALALQSAVRPSDTLARTGGDEFTLRLPNTTEKQAVIVVERIIKNLQSATKVKKDGVSMSFGIASVDMSIEDPQTALKEALARADKAMYVTKEKSGHKGREYAVYTEEIEAEAARIAAEKEEAKRREEAMLNVKPAIEKPSNSKGNGNILTRTGAALAGWVSGTFLGRS